MRVSFLLEALLALTAMSAESACRPAPGAGGAGPLRLERSLKLAGVRGRIDHLAFDAAHQRLFVAELGNGSVDSVSLADGATKRIGGLKEPQGLAYLPAQNELVVASGGDGSLRFYDGATLAPRASLALGKDADNVRLDAATGNLVVGAGKALTIVDPRSHIVIRAIALPAHPEGFQIDGRGIAYVNLPDAGRILAVDLAKGRVLASWPAAHALNFPLALDPDGDRLAIVYRLPARLALIDRTSGANLQDLPTCGDADDLFADAKRRRLYVVCGSGKVEIFQRGDKGYASIGRVATRPGARTGLFVAEQDRLFVAAREAFPGAEASILEFAPN